ncbi:hypothetical protein PPGU16_37860 [Paraburkholderia largidicola]|uniref:Uncharacterized protein n=1 Tax=Paraburkholderia largidicola TaxID=3014751 RepID=A0A7I8BQW2_9BURK|nr:hypothetical protein PPGU16_37860 [Paraburkholderia sp. PGU16]
MIHNTMAADTMRTDVNVAGSIEVPFNAMRHSSELPAKANMATIVSKAMRMRGMVGWTEKENVVGLHATVA